MLPLFKSITTFIFDIDGVLTDGSLYVLNSGEQVRRMNIKDGYALQLAVKKKYRVAAFSGSESEAVVRRLQKLGIEDVFMKVENKLARIESYLQAKNVMWNEVLFMGDDIPDLSVMKKAGIACAPSDAAHEIRQVAKYISRFTGGNGCVRDVIETVLRLNDHWEMDTAIPSK